MPDDRLQFEHPTIRDHGTIAEHTFTRCGGEHAPKDYREFPLDKFGECSEGHAS